MKLKKSLTRLGTTLILTAYASNLWANPLSLLEGRLVPRAEWDNTGIAPNFADMSKHTAEVMMVVIGHTVTGSSVIAEAAKKSLQGLSVPELAKAHHDIIAAEKEIMQGILKAHSSRGFADIGGHDFVSPSGLLYEGRLRDFKGAHTVGSNDRSIGFYFMGCFDEVGCRAEGYAVNKVTEEMVDTAARAIAYYSIEYGLDLEKQLASPELTKENKENVAIWPRSTLDVAERDKTGFPYSPGNLIIDKFPEILKRANAYKVDYVQAEAAAAESEGKRNLTKIQINFSEFTQEMEKKSKEFAEQVADLATRRSKQALEIVGKTAGEKITTEKE